MVSLALTGGTAVLHFRSAACGNECTLIINLPYFQTYTFVILSLFRVVSRNFFLVTKSGGSGQTATAPRHFTFVNINKDYLTASFVCLVHCSQFINTLLASTRDFGTHRISEQLRFRRVCAHAQSRLKIRFSHTQCRSKPKSKSISA